MAGFSPMFNALGAGLGMGVNDLIQQRQREQQMALQQMGMQRELAYLNMYLQNQQANQDVAALAGGIGGGVGGAGGMPPISTGQPMPAMTGGGIGGPVSAPGRFGGMSMAPGGMAGVLGNISGVPGPLAGQPGAPANQLPWAQGSGQLASLPPPRTNAQDAQIAAGIPRFQTPKGQAAISSLAASPDNTPPAQPQQDRVTVDPLSAMADPAQAPAAPQGQQYAQAAEQGPTWADAQAIVQQRVASLGHVPTQKAVNDAVALVFKQLRTEWQERNTARTQERVLGHEAETVRQGRERIQLEKDRMAADAAQRKVTAEETTQNWEVVDKDGNPVWQGAGHVTKGQKGLTDVEGNRIAVPPGGNIRELKGTSMLIGSRENVLIQRSLTAGIEVATELGNIAQMPIEISGGYFGAGRHQGPRITDATKEQLAQALTPTMDKFYNDAKTGIERELTGLITGGVYINQHTIDSFAQLTLQPTDDVFTKLHKLATLRQNAANALEAVLVNPRVGKEQKAFAQKQIDEMAKAIPWSPNDVVKLYNSDDPKASITQVAKEHGLGGPQPGSVEGGFRFKGGSPGDPSNWEPVPPENK